MATTVPGSVNRLQTFLKSKHLSWTMTRSLVFEALSDKPYALPDLVRKLEAKTDRSSVYRTVELFEELGVVHRIWQGWKSVIELTDKFSQHHHHFVCQNCSKLIDFDDPQIEAMLSRLSEDHNFQVEHHHLELFGRCPTCRKSN